MRAATAFLVPLLLCSSAGADSLRATRMQDLNETKHDVRVRVKNGIATYRVRRTFVNAGKRHEEAVLDFGMPFGAAATGLRIKTPSGWYEGELMRAERAARIYQELTGFGPHTVKDPALLQWRWANELQLRIFPVAPGGGQATVEYTLTGPTTYQDGRYVVSYPLADGDLATPKIRVKGHDARASVWIDGNPVKAGERIALAPREVPAWADAGKLADRYAVSELVIPDDLEATKVSVAIDVRHTFRGDLAVQLVPPASVSDAWHDLHSQEGGSDNDVRKTVEVVLSKSKAVSVKGKWRLVVTDHAALDVGTIDGWTITLEGGAKAKKYAAKDAPKFIPDAPSGAAGNLAVIQVDPPPIRTVAARLGRVEAAADKQFFRLEIDTAPQLRPMPKRPNVVFVIDASKSLPDLTSQLAIVRSFLRNATDAKAEVVLYRRHATRLFGDFIAAADVPARLEKAEADGKLTLGNGSALDEGLRVAREALSKHRGTRMLVMASDNLLRPSWKNEHALAILNKTPLRAAHVVLPSIHDGFVGDARDRRDDKHALAPLATKNGGILLHIDRPADEDKELDDVTLGLVRPTRIDDFRVHGVNLPSAVPKVMHEGQGLREMALLSTAPSKVRLTGKIWSQPFSRVVQGPLSFSEATAAFVFSHDMHDDLSEEEMVRVAFAGKVVSPVTSYLALEPGVRPSEEGLVGVGEGGGGRGEGIGLGSVGTIGHGGGSTCPSYDIADDVDAAVQVCVAKHAPAKGTKISLKVDTTFDEVVDVVTATGTTPRGLTSCLVDAVWTAELSSCRFTARRERVSVDWTF